VKRWKLVYCTRVGAILMSDDLAPRVLVFRLTVIQIAFILLSAAVGFGVMVAAYSLLGTTGLVLCWLANGVGLVAGGLYAANEAYVDEDGEMTE